MTRGTKTLQNILVALFVSENIVACSKSLVFQQVLQDLGYDICSFWRTASWNRRLCRNELRKGNTSGCQALSSTVCSFTLAHMSNMNTSYAAMCCKYNTG